ncbi:hypothetical protein [Lichenicoccus sp.]|uniref:hypothetical protein n=1 Tax=Lichenicoccus sp. TaxID=2781899 RepID=UPI003D0B1AE8
MQITPLSEPSSRRQDAPLVPSAAPSRRLGTIPVTVRLDLPRYDRMKQLVRRFSTTSQSLIQAALDRRMTMLERQRGLSPRDGATQPSLFAPPPVSGDARRGFVQERFDFVRPEPTVALTYRATVPMHRWLHRRSAETGRSIQDILSDALKAAGGPG